jgi:hypothetical protein
MWQALHCRKTFSPAAASCASAGPETTITASGAINKCLSIDHLHGPTNV